MVDTSTLDEILEDFPFKEILHLHAQELPEIITYAGTIYGLMGTLPKMSITRYLEEEMISIEKEMLEKLRKLRLPDKSKCNYDCELDKYIEIVDATKYITSNLIKLALLNELKEAAKQGPKGLEKYRNILREHYEVLTSGEDLEKMKNIANYLIGIVGGYRPKVPKLKYKINEFALDLEVIDIAERVYRDKIRDDELKKKLEELSNKLNMYKSYIEFLKEVAIPTICLIESNY
jgi:hypothetical protein